MAACLELGFDRRFHCDRAQSVKPGDLVLCERGVREIRERLAAPQRQRCAEARRRAGVRTFSQGRCALADELLEAQGVDLFWFDAQQVAAARRLNQLARATILLFAERAP